MAQFKRKDGYALMRLVIKELTGQDVGTIIDTKGFINAGSLAADYKTDEIFDALTTVYTRTRMAVRNYKAKLWLIDSIDNDMYANRLRKISVYSSLPLPSGHFNTDLYTNLAAYFDNGTNPSGGVDQSTGSMWEQHPMYPLELHFDGSTTWQDALTRYKDQIKNCFLNESGWLEFWNGVAAQKNNDIELQKEGWARMTLLGRMALAMAIGDPASDIAGACTAINMTKAFNDYFNPVTPYTTAELLTTYLKEFTEFFVSTFKDYSDLMERPSIAFHATPVYTDVAGEDHVILRHTPKDKQRFMLFNAYWRKAEAMVMPEIFNDVYLDFEKQFEPVDFWQNFGPSIDDRAAINVNVVVPGWLESLITSGLTTVDTEYAAKIDYVLGVLYDVDSVMVSHQLTDVSTTSVEARKGYYTSWYTMAKNSISDPTENFILFYMADPEEP